MPKRAPRNSQSIPSGQNFSPSEVDLPTILELVRLHEGNRKALTEAIRHTFYSTRPVPRKGSTVWANVTTGMARYGIIDETAKFTDLGAELYALRTDAPALYQRLAKHLLFSVSGILLIDTLLDMQAAGETPTLPTIREALAERSATLSPAGKSVSLLRLWLAKAGLFRSQWSPNKRRYYELIGKTESEVAALAKLPEGQKAVLKMLAALGPGHYDSSELRQATQRAYGVVLNEKQFPKDALYPLRSLGYLTTTRKGGRAWTLDVEPTSQLDSEIVIPLLEQLGGLDPKLRELLRLDLPSIVAKIDIEDTYEKGLALEAFGFKLMRTVGLSYVSTRFRPRSGRFEVDLLFDTQRLSYSRWQVQCKNKDRVSLDDVAKEVGLTYYLLSNVIVLLTRGEVGGDARRYSNNVMRKTNLAIVLIDGADIEEIVANPLAVFDVLEREAEFALDLKPLDDQVAARTAGGDVVVETDEPVTLFDD
jgi:hypothetical protein